MSGLFFKVVIFLLADFCTGLKSSFQPLDDEAILAADQPVHRRIVLNYKGQNKRREKRIGFNIRNFKDGVAGVYVGDVTGHSAKAKGVISGAKILQIAVESGPGEYKVLWRQSDYVEDEFINSTKAGFKSFVDAMKAWKEDLSARTLVMDFEYFKAPKPRRRGMFTSLSARSVKDNAECYKNDRCVMRNI